MNIEETNPAASLRDNAKWLTHVHLADNTRKQPGSGITDFSAAFRALKEAGYRGAVALECGITGTPDDVLPKCVHFLKTQMGLAFVDR